jgi:hypothetical protein
MPPVAFAGNLASDVLILKLLDAQFKLNLIVNEKTVAMPIH